VVVVDELVQVLEDVLLVEVVVVAVPLMVVVAVDVLVTVEVVHIVVLTKKCSVSPIVCVLVLFIITVKLACRPEVVAPKADSSYDHETEERDPTQAWVQLVPQLALPLPGSICRETVNWSSGYSELSGFALV
jgi:hypothetical protein